MQQSIEQCGTMFGNALRDIDQVRVRIDAVAPAGDVQRRGDVDALVVVSRPIS